MAASNWFQAVWDEKGKPIDGLNEIKHGIYEIELYKNYFWMRQQGDEREMPIHIQSGDLGMPCGKDKYITIYVKRVNYGCRGMDDDMFAIVETYTKQPFTEEYKYYVIASGYTYDRLPETSKKDEGSWDGALCVEPEYLKCLVMEAAKSNMGWDKVFENTVFEKCKGW